MLKRKLSTSSSTSPLLLKPFSITVTNKHPLFFWSIRFCLSSKLIVSHSSFISPPSLRNEDFTFLPTFSTVSSILLSEPLLTLDWKELVLVKSHKRDSASSALIHKRKIIAVRGTSYDPPSSFPCF